MLFRSDNEDKNITRVLHLIECRKQIQEKNQMSREDKDVNVKVSNSHRVDGSPTKSLKKCLRMRVEPVKEVIPIARRTRSQTPKYRIYRN